MGFLGRKDKKPLGIYIHVPFCRSKCQYCDFYSLTTKDNRLMDDYLSAVCTHIKEAGLLAPNYLVDTVYFGGGTPSLFGAEGMITILNTVRKSFKVAPSAEITCESDGFNNSFFAGTQSAHREEFLHNLKAPPSVRSALEKAFR